MPNPKRRHSKSRRGKRRAHDAIQATGLGLCPNCQQTKMLHRACPNCGYYDGRQVIAVPEI